jgi:hypothetical protein
MPTVAGKLRMPGMRKVWALEFAAGGPPQAWLPIVRGCDGLSRAQERGLGDRCRPLLLAAKSARGLTRRGRNLLE